ncbi:TPA: type II secretion system F family protein [archaeon]|uniref:Type II secretion system F family protein n=1 Tax=Candidatus Naiadarchaeum limnaeum TaxID=2756139 RepID=A0A832V4J9_9ARCH|nr:type II secretion system F family protein [Candidatus Naiadarchaeales archaeon SRR2090153.bin1042]HIK00060.1 type II secretion system F family protein [Candidatus Naiadarchaeum limnaeum]
MEINIFKKNTKEEKKTKESEEFLGLSKKKQLLYFSIIFAALITLIAILLAPPRLYALFVGLSVMVAFIPYSLHSYFEAARLRDMEDNLPEFLRDIAEARKTGMTLPEAVYKSMRIDYGRLTPEVQKMAYQISWGIPFDEVLKRFAKRIKSRFIERAIAIIIQAQISGGALTDTLDSVARDATLIKEAEKERKTKLNQQALIMYAIYILFVIIVIALQKLMIPLITSQGFTLATQNPEEIVQFYKNLFFSMIVIQAVFNGMLAGQISEGSPVIGLKHSAIFLAFGVVASWFFIL